MKADGSLTPGDRFCVGFVVFAAVAVPVAIAAMHFFGFGVSSAALGRWIAGLVAASLGCLIAVQNVHLCLSRPWLYKRRNGSMDGYQFVSVVPLAGTAFIFLGALLLPAHWIFGILLLSMELIDMGGVHWAALAFVREYFTNGRYVA